MTNAQQAIDDSISQNRIVHIDEPTQEDLDCLMVESDDSVENGPVTEYWGRDEDSNDWRVHVAR